MKIAFVTQKTNPTGSEEESLLAHAFADLGITTNYLPWDSVALDTQSISAALIRTPWNYHRHPRAFRTWLTKLETAGIPIINPARLLLWNMHKAYLLDLAAKGCAIVPTELIPQGTTANLPGLFKQFNSDRLVFKPAISATAYQTKAIWLSEASQQQNWLFGQLRQQDMLVQPFMTEIVKDGEWSLLFFGGKFCHAVLKQAQAGDYRVQSDFGGTTRLVTPNPHILALAETVLQNAPSPPVYARIDGIVRNGIFKLMELELIEPQCFLTHQPKAPNMLAQACLSYLKTKALDQQPSHST